MFEQRTITQVPYEWEIIKPAVRPDYRQAAYALLRLVFGMLFLVAGIGKFVRGIGNFEAGLESQFAGKLPLVLLKPFGYALPFAEVIVGALIIAGLFNGIALVICGLELMVLTFGLLVAGDTANAAHNVQYAFVNFVLLWFAADYNGYSLDRMIHGHPK